MINLRQFSAVSLALLLLPFLVGCGARTADSTATAEVTATADLCTGEALKAEIEKVNQLMREFDDASVLAANTARDQLRPAISELQRIRRGAEDLDVPACLSDLKKIQLGHMNLVIATLTGFMGGADQATLNEGIRRARQLHDQYLLEIARLLGITVVPVTAAVQPTATGAAAAPATPAGVFLSNPGPTTVNLRSAPSLDAGSLGILDVGLSALVVGRTADNQWLLIEIPGLPGSTAWVFASLVTVSSPIDSVPVSTPSP